MAKKRRSLAAKKGKKAGDLRPRKLGSVRAAYLRPKTSFSSSVVRAAGLARICASC